MTADPQASRPARFGLLALVLDLLALGCLVLSIVLLVSVRAGGSFEGLRFAIAGKKILSISQWERPYVASLLLVVARFAITMRFAPEAFRARYRTRFGRLKPRLTVVLFILLAGLFLIEGGFRLFHREDPLPTLVFDDHVIDRSETQTEFLPEIEGIFCGTLLVTDRHGFRCRPGRPEPAPDDYRVLVLGDSIAYGVGVPAEETFPFVAESRLRERGHRVFVFNGSVSGYSTREEYEVLVDDGLATEPDLVVLVWCFNDPMTVEPWTPLQSQLAAEIQVFGFLWQRLTANPARYNPARINEYYVDGQPKWEECKTYLARIRDLCQREGIEFRVAIFPLLDHLLDYPFGPAHEALRAFLGRAGIAYRDWLDLFVDQDPAPFWVHPADHHPSAEACRMAGEDLADLIEPFVVGR